MARSLGVDPKTVRKYVRAAIAAGLVPAGPALSDERWRDLAREWFPALASTQLRRSSWPEIARHRDRIEALVGLVPASVLHQRLVDEEGLGASVASLRRYLRANFADEVRWGEVVIWRPPVDPGDEGQVDYGYLGNWLDPSCGRRRRVWAFSMVLAYCRHLFVYRVLKMDQQTWVDAHVAAFSFFGGFPRRVVLENVPRNIFGVMWPTALCARGRLGPMITGVIGPTGTISAT